MLDINLIRTNPEKVRQALLKRLDAVDLEPLLALDRKRRELIVEADALKMKKNAASATVKKLDQAAQQAVFAEMKEISAKVKALDAEAAAVEAGLAKLMAELPNLPADDVVAGGKESNAVLRDWGAKPEFGFPAKAHLELCKDLALVDYERGVKLGGTGFWVYKDLGARLEWALLNFFVDTHLSNKYSFVLPPHILNYDCGYTAGQFPKFKDDVFLLASAEEKVQFLLPTSETALISLHRDEVMKEDELPKKYFAYSPCYRKEAGGYGSNERGMIRGHQFNKVELIQFTRPEDSPAAFEEMLGVVEGVMQKLGLHYRVVKLAAKDCSASMARTTDIEVWIPSMKAYKEVSSVSSANDYQARRGNMRFKRGETGKNEFVHTLNGSCLATSRLFPAILEQFQQADGSVTVPEALRKYLGTDKITL
ncbi:MAG: serine--tRNA ligase [Elusimicrobia bacterium GWA2_61_42]|nr:MAG: serine--tRNA ligase [Elusimicrobia bacterium GWA2_61_42]OGR77671.1 MAG: serine--tRNA ligase [Elusimicrobia bacterium GWC2_61_25]